jgi:hypothetical protein
MKKKVASEAEFRRAIIQKAFYMGCDDQVKQLFNKYDNLLKGCTNNVERKQISYLGIVELYKLLDCYGGLTIGGVEILPPDPNANKDDDA